MTNRASFDLRFVLPLVPLLLGCQPSGPGDALPGDSAGRSPSPFSRPEGVRIIQGRLFVTSTNGHWNVDAGGMEYGTGFVSVLDPDTLEVLGSFETPWLNPQTVLAAGEEAAVICSGRLDTDEDWNMAAASPGGVVFIDPATLETMRTVEIPPQDPGPLAGFPGSAAYGPESGLLFVGSGTGPYIYRIDAAAGEPAGTISLYDDPPGNDFAVPLCHTGTLFATSQKKGLLYRLDPAGGTPLGDPLDVTRTDQYEGPIDMLVAGGTLYVLHTISTEVVAVDLETWSVSLAFGTGAAPNRLAWREHGGEGFLYVVNSMDNNLTRYAPATGSSVKFAPLPPGTNPWEMAVWQDSGFVTGYLTDTVFEVSLVTGEVLAVAGR